ncbi:MAG: putative membrane protein [Phycisphaerae bacterium]|nr:MAG: putative membrane protein [Phycisphaerae bacterium]
MLARLGRSVADHPILWIVGWLLVAAGLAVTTPSPEELARIEPRSLLAADEPYNRSLDLERTAFPEIASRTRTVVIFESDAPLSSAHEAFIRNLSNQLQGDMAADRGWTVISPTTQPLMQSRLRSEDGQSVMVVVCSDTNYLTRRSVGDVETIESMIAGSLPDGLRFEITGEGGLGRDLVHSSEEAFERTTHVTLLALLVILVIVYRAPLAASVPLCAIGLSVIVAIMLLNHFTRVGWELGSIEKTIVVVLLFGSGTDYALFWLAEYRSGLGDPAKRFHAASKSTRVTGPAIIASAATTVCGLLMLMAAKLLPSFNAGRALAIALTVSLVAALTLVPAMAVVLGRGLYWPRRRGAAASNQSGRFWKAIARSVVAHPVRSVVCCLLLFAWPIYRGWNVHYTYDALGVIPQDSSAARGQDLAAKHFSSEQLFSWTCILKGDAVASDVTKAVDHSKELARICRKNSHVVDVWSLATPLGDPTRSAAATLAATDIGRNRSQSFYLSTSANALRLEVMLDAPPLSDAAMGSCASVLSDIESWSHQTFSDDVAVYATGLTPYILDIKSVADTDEVRVTGLVIVIIFLIVAFLVRDLLLAVIMIAATLLVFFVTLGVTEWFFVEIMGQGGIDWKVKLFAFVILVAVGQDYNIFLVTRILQEHKLHELPLAVERAIASTGGVISSCGAIMAATLGSLAATGLPFFQELGMAFALGVLVDTFLVRPILVPAALLVIRGHRQPTLQSAEILPVQPTP